MNDSSFIIRMLLKTPIDFTLFYLWNKSLRFVDWFLYEYTMTWSFYDDVILHAQTWWTPITNRELAQPGILFNPPLLRVAPPGFVARAAIRIHLGLCFMFEMVAICVYNISDHILVHRMQRNCWRLMQPVSLQGPPVWTPVAPRTS